MTKRSPLFVAKNLSIRVGEEEILTAIDLTIGKGEVQAIIGPNGAGKSTLGYGLAGKPGYQVTKGEVTLGGESLLSMSIEERAKAGLFLAFQQPIALPGVRNIDLLRMAIRECRKARGEADLKPLEAIKLIKEKAEVAGLKPAFLSRSVNEDFSGGERKRNELLQLLLLKPQLAILDEVDSGLDKAARNWLGKVIRELQQAGTSFLVITHYIEQLSTISLDKVHIMEGGRIVYSGDGKDSAWQKRYEEINPLKDG